MPASQLLHSLAPEPDDLPATHEMHAAALTFDHVPPSHLVHALLPSPEYVPLSHDAQREAPVLDAKWPDAHAVQATLLSLSA